jgi:hypothetical protein
MYTLAGSAQFTVVFGIYLKELRKTVKSIGIARFRDGNWNRELPECEATIANITNALDDFVVLYGEEERAGKGTVIQYCKPPSCIHKSAEHAGPY